MNTPGASMPPAAAPGTADSYIIGHNTRPANPTPLSAPQEQQVRDLYYKNVRAKCAAEIEAFAQCALGRTLTMIYACRAPRLAMNTCMLQYQNQDSLDAARSEWFALAEERKAARLEHKRRLLDAREKHKEWWNLDDGGRLQGQGAEVVRREENKVDGGGQIPVSTTCIAVPHPAHRTRRLCQHSAPNFSAPHPLFSRPHAAAPDSPGVCGPHPAPRLLASVRDE
ncbi:cytochrome c oxidase biogenesis protein Cmc1 like-domain-containing protein [Boeremia exigua]|uniref:cytochrome c oxidase biogenesis protein Cmc1 like-domain-containing protein n=1 Tax=Boeremia exigua TaxID=749465 RepID=UPI001E8EA0DB|nr:cytochrome c oxidase biogenesis protein Cmc1 like-domain-containing protein [Boeremia exigua]KAH6642840.1 cytochrome c oxidase biogenesis protein Cmc1 like-domain-containing protein [Boeremia exigua]